MVIWFRKKKGNTFLVEVGGELADSLNACGVFWTDWQIVFNYAMPSEGVEYASVGNSIIDPIGRTRSQ